MREPPTKKRKPTEDGECVSRLRRTIELLNNLVLGQNAVYNPFLAMTRKEEIPRRCRNLPPIPQNGVGTWPERSINDTYKMFTKATQHVSPAGWRYLDSTLKRWEKVGRLLVLDRVETLELPTVNRIRKTFTSGRARGELIFVDLHNGKALCRSRYSHRLSIGSFRTTRSNSYGPASMFQDGLLREKKKALQRLSKKLRWRE